MRKLLAYTVGFLFVAYIDVLGISVQWQVADGGNGHYYEQIAASVTWTQAMQLAANANYLGMPGHLVTIASSAENVFILTNVYVGNYAWIGFTDNEAFGGSESFGQSNPQVDGWVWVTGEPITFTGWYPGEPDNLNNEDFALFDTHAEPANGLGWNDDQSSSTAPYIVEFEAVPEPSTFILSFAGLGLTVLLCAQRRHHSKEQV